MSFFCIKFVLLHVQNLSVLFLVSAIKYIFLLLMQISVHKSHIIWQYNVSHHVIIEMIMQRNDQFDLLEKCNL